MEELIKIEYQYGEALVSGRELHDFLGVKTRYDTWFARMVEYGFSLNVDYIEIQEKVDAQKRARTYEQVNHLMKVNMAKEIAMVQRNEKGKIARQYFLQIEAYWNSPEMVMKRALEFANQRVAELQQQNQLLEQKRIEDEPKVIGFEQLMNSEGLISIKTFAKSIGERPYKFFDKLRNMKLIYKDGDCNLPLEGNYRDCFHLKTKRINNGEIKYVTLIKPDKLDKLIRKLVKEGVMQKDQQPSFSFGKGGK